MPVHQPDHPITEAHHCRCAASPHRGQAGGWHAKNHAGSHSAGQQVLGLILCAGQSTAADVVYAASLVIKKTQSRAFLTSGRARHPQCVLNATAHSVHSAPPVCIVKHPNAAVPACCHGHMGCWGSGQPCDAPCMELQEPIHTGPLGQCARLQPHACIILRDFSICHLRYRN